MLSAAFLCSPNCFQAGLRHIQSHYQKRCRPPSPISGDIFGTIDLDRIPTNTSQMPSASFQGHCHVAVRHAAACEVFVMKSGTQASKPRHCLECGKPIIHRRSTAFYCSGKCREAYNANKRRLARENTKKTAPPADKSETDA